MCSYIFRYTLSEKKQNYVSCMKNIKYRNMYGIIFGKIQKGLGYGCFWNGEFGGWE